METICQTNGGVNEVAYLNHETSDKSANVLSSLNHLNSGSPCNSVYIPNKIELDSLETEISRLVQSGTGEKISIDHVLINHQSHFHNNSEDSFMTTESVIDESFQSAITHLGENVEAFIDGNLINNSQNLDLIDFDNETLESSYCPEKTVRQNSSEVETVSKESQDDFTQVAHTTNKVEEKPDEDAFPPLILLSPEEKTEAVRQKDPKSEVFFLHNDNLYYERERAKYETEIAALTERIRLLEEKLKEKNEESTQFVRVLDEYCEFIEKLISEVEPSRETNSKQAELLKRVSPEKESDETHFRIQDVKDSVCDLFAKYDKAKKVIAIFRANEATYKKALAEQAAMMEDFKEKAAARFEKYEKELEDTEARHKEECARLKAQLKKKRSI